MEIWKTYPYHQNSDYFTERAAQDGTRDRLRDDEEILAKTGDFDLDGDGFKDDATSPVWADSDFDGLTDDNATETNPLTAQLPAYTVEFADNFTILIDKTITSADGTTDTNSSTWNLSGSVSGKLSQTTSWKADVGIKIGQKGGVKKSTNSTEASYEVSGELSYSTGLLTGF